MRLSSQVQVGARFSLPRSVLAAKLRATKSAQCGNKHGGVVATRDDAAKRLKLIISANGSSLLNETDALRGLLLRGQSDSAPELRALMIIAEKGAVSHLIKWSTTPPDQRPTYVQMRDRIAQKFGAAGVMPEELAQWC